jgi:DNA-binding winged helix-turn-helix (wHTH) protein
MNKQIKGLYEFGEYRLDAVERLLLRGDEPIPLTPKAFDTL